MTVRHRWLAAPLAAAAFAALAAILPGLPDSVIDARAAAAAIAQPAGQPAGGVSPSAAPAPGGGGAAAMSDQVPAALRVPHAYEDYTLPRPSGPDPMLPAFPDARSAGLDAEAFTHLMLRARFFHSDAVVVLKDGRLVANQRFGKAAAPIELMSATKSVAALAIGRLLETGRIRSLDQLVATWYPQWQKTSKQPITLRQLMNQTSGIQAQASAEEVYASPNLVQLALDADLAHFPGSHFFYNNKAVNLLAGIVEKASGRKLDVYMKDEIFAPLGITRFSWMRDPSGNPHVMAGLQLDALDAARIGQLMLQGGTYAGKRLVSPAFVSEAVHTAQPYVPTGGLLWWVLPEWTRMRIDQALLDTWRRGGADPAFLAAVTPLAGRDIARDELFNTLDRAFGHEQAGAMWVHNVAGRDLPTPKVQAGPAYGFDANGYLGQYIVVIPGANLVAVRQMRDTSQQSSADDFDSFPELVRALAPTAPAAAPGR